jgi:hypothetical protein
VIGTPVLSVIASRAFFCSGVTTRYTSPERLRELDYKGNAYYGECQAAELPNKGRE